MNFFNNQNKINNKVSTKKRVIDAENLSEKMSSESKSIKLKHEVPIVPAASHPAPGRSIDLCDLDGRGESPSRSMEETIAELRWNAESQAKEIAAERKRSARLQREMMRILAAEAEARGAGDEKTRALGDRLQVKENELSVQMNLVLELRREKEQLQDTIRGMQSTNDSIKKLLMCELPAPAPAADNAQARRELFEPNDNELSFSPTPNSTRCARRGKERASPASPAPAPPAAAGADASYVDQSLFHFLSDSSMNSNELDQDKVNARFEAMARGSPLPPVSLQTLKKRRRRADSSAGDSSKVSLSQVKSEQTNPSSVKKCLDVKC